MSWNGDRYKNLKTSKYEREALAPAAVNKSAERDYVISAELATKSLQSLRSAELSIIIPTFNERENICTIVSAVDEALPDICWEIVFIDDDSPDGTASLVRDIARNDPRVRILHRFGRRGLSSACVEGIMSTASSFIAIMDADHQHDERILRRMYDIIKVGDADLVVGRRALSGLGAWFFRRIAGAPVTDPMSGFFMIRRDAFLDTLPRLSSIGFKLLVDIMASSTRPLKVVEVPYTFRSRQRGDSKLDSMVLWEYLLLIVDKSIAQYLPVHLPVRFISFALIGGTGILVHLSILTILFKLFDVQFAVSQAAATFVAITSNFVLNNLLTYRDQRLHGWRLLLGWLSFNLVCGIGALANVGVANWMYAQNSRWLVSAIAGIAVGIVWNYAMSSIVTWSKR
jgi:dolichol-phosphate mannosyltransferase